MVEGPTTTNSCNDDGKETQDEEDSDEAKSKFVAAAPDGQPGKELANSKLCNPNDCSVSEKKWCRHAYRLTHGVEDATRED